MPNAIAGRSLRDLQRDVSPYSGARQGRGSDSIVPDGGGAYLPVPPDPLRKGGLAQAGLETSMEVFRMVNVALRAMLFALASEGDDPIFARGFYRALGNSR